MGDSDVEQIRAARLAQLQQGRAQGGGPTGGDDEEAQRERISEQRQSILLQILHPEALDRLNRIRLVKASRATDVENRLIQLAQTGQLREKVTEDQLKELLSAISANEGGGGSGTGSGSGSGAGIEYRGRRKGGWDDDDEDLEALLNR
ncbi:putative dsdna-binding protein pdcd5 [Phaeomoniella chlamydospora]|uniref:Putative dsdna-binding protein pdcd5 n=1 Tax=Phaeomoniella chlamydospora TaxID=158046 RepID=A0A0G2GWD2_PHACM|nr:putative dsdna-binding protein pdcd5 [Phaeomoniella chlamydospora]